MFRTSLFLCGFSLALFSSFQASFADSTTSSGTIDAGNYLPSTSDLVSYSQKNLTEVELFARCYRHLTKMYLPRTHALRVKVASGQMTALAACNSLIDKTMFTTAGKISTDDSESRAILKNFFTFHNNWFANTDLGVTVPVIENYAATTNVYDNYEPSLYLTRALFGGNKYSYVVTANDSMEAVRERVGLVAQPAPSVLSSVTAPLAATIADVTPAGGVQVGQLIGVIPMASSARANDAINLYSAGSSFSYGTGPSGTPAPIAPSISVKTTALKLHDHFGGGIIGSKTYYLLNNGRNARQATNGGLYVPRRWAKMVYHDLLCRDIPVIRNSDSALYVVPAANVTSYTPPFRQGQSCMQCHQSMDGMAYVARNLVMTSTAAGNTDNSDEGLATVVALTPNLPREVGVVESEPSFSQRPPNGKLLFRSYDGTLIDKPVNGLADLGNALAATNDLYVCAASRYFEYFTGVHINLQDAGDSSLTALTADEKKYRALVIQMGLDLKSNQSLPKLMEAIMAQPIYRTSSMRYVDQGSN